MRMTERCNDVLVLYEIPHFRVVVSRIDGKDVLILLLFWALIQTNGASIWWLVMGLCGPLLSLIFFTYWRFRHDHLTT